MATRPFLYDDETEDFNDAPLKLHSVFDFLDAGEGAADGSGGTERQHVSSNESESESESLFADTPSSLRLTPYISAAARPTQCYCLDKTNCMCTLFALPPVLTRKSTSAAAVTVDFGGMLSSSSLPEEAPAETTVLRMPRVLESVHYVPLHLTDLHLTKAQTSTRAPATASTRTGTSSTCCRC